MYDTTIDSIGLQTSVDGNSIRHNFEILGFFSIFNIMKLLIMWRLFNKYCSSCRHQKPGKHIFSV